ncbi:Receptor-like protein EIX2 isoform B [Glycine soja]|uniref:Receptor-like protein EIX2 isoform B n=1 Tax=Glycine soja TaxID=3848 RepID=A0A445GJX0_GLYSO|nr:Receptor-like protein EIX2 isoform B [Glycine soja]
MCIEREREALLQFKAALVDDYGMLSSWTTSDCCQWQGIRCTNLTAHVLMLDLHGQLHYSYAFNRITGILSQRFIRGEIHKSLMELQQLNYLNLSSNDFQGRGIPEFLGSLTNLRYLDLSYSDFEGKIPTQFGSLSHLKYLDLCGNLYLQGSIPLQLGNLSQLQHLDLRGNQFEGNIPSQIGNLSQLQHLDLRGNQFEGNIPSQIGNLSQLQHLDLRGNQFEGNIPSQIGNLSQLQHLDLSYNSFEGSIPSQLGNLSNLQKLYLGGPALKIDDGDHWLSNLISLTHLSFHSISNLNTYHSFFQMIAKLPKLRELSLIDCSLSDHFILSLRPSKFNFSSSLSRLDLSWNSFTSSMILQWLSNVTSNLVELDLSGNLLEGSTSNHFGRVMNSLEHLDLSNNIFKGDDFKSFANICTLRSLYATENNFSEDLPSILHNLSSGCVRHSLQDLDLSYNQITGSLPDLSVFSSLKTLVLKQNQLSGNIPEGIRLPFHLESLSIQSNSLEGGIPKSFGNSCALRSLDMSGNNLNKELSVIIHQLSGCARFSLQELNIGGNQINGTLSDLSIFSALKTLDLSENQLNGKIPESTKLPYLLESLSIGSHSLEGGIPKSFGNSCALRSLDMSGNNLNKELSVIIHQLSGCARFSLQELNIGGNQINGNNLNKELSVIIHQLSGCARFSLQELNIRGNQINGTLSDLSMFSALKTLDLSENQLNGKIPESTKLPSLLESLSIGSNSLEGGIPKSFGDACALRSLDMYNNSLSEEFPMIIHHLSGCARYSLEQLDLSMNQINGTLPDLSIFSSLRELNLYVNKLNGEIPKDNKFPPQLEQLVLQSNSLKGVLTDYHFANMSKLYFLDLSGNSLLALAFSQNWVPPFQLSHIILRSCKLGPVFPKWLETQNQFRNIDISNAGIADMVPKWFWANLAFREWISMNISYNNLHGIIPNFPIKNIQYSQTLGPNQFDRPIPPFLQGFLFLDLSKNQFSDSLSFLCVNGTVETLYQLDLSSNRFSGKIPDCWSHFKSLSYLDLSHNNFSGRIPTSMGSLLHLQALLLRNNNLTDEIPFSLRSCTNLVMLDIAENRLSGLIPAWIGSELQELQFLSLGRNNFHGSLPLQICYLSDIQLLDVSLNSMSGQIPKCIKNFTSMTQKTSSQGHSYYVHTKYLVGNQTYDLNALLMWKGSEQMFKNNVLLLLKSIDLSSNHFSGEIPLEIENLFGLVSLNLSRNHLTGAIPSNIGKLTSLDFLDLSRNHLVGSIPLSLTQIDRLGVLDLSHNNLSGEIPTGTQLQSFNASCYEDNLDLCGPPLEKLCIDGKPAQEPIVKLPEDEKLLFTREFYMSMAIGFVISFWGVFGSILIKRSWRHAYFKFISNLSDAIYVMVAVKVSKWRHRG